MFNNSLYKNCMLLDLVWECYQFHSVDEYEEIFLPHFRFRLHFY